MKTFEFHIEKAEEILAEMEGKTAEPSQIEAIIAVVNARVGIANAITAHEQLIVTDKMRGEVTAMRAELNEP